MWVHVTTTRQGLCQGLPLVNLPGVFSGITPGKFARGYCSWHIFLANCRISCSGKGWEKISDTCEKNMKGMRKKKKKYEVEEEVPSMRKKISIS